ncbi:MAG: hypothetical protein EB060_00920 [Proteobacteria bacterium]|nr:hypothetical protein [Pseudomonadota bacterium]
MNRVRQNDRRGWTAKQRAERAAQAHAFRVVHGASNPFLVPLLHIKMLVIPKHYEVESLGNRFGNLTTET